MHLKDYQVKVLERVSTILQVLKEKHAEAQDFAHFQQSRGKPVPPPEIGQKTWEELNARGLVPRLRDPKGGTVAASWIARHDPLGREIPCVCLKIPTGGGKTLLGAHAVERINVDYFARQTGFVLWIVPSESIYKQTWKLLANRESPYRQVLERASGGRVMLLEKNDSFNRQDVSSQLCVMLLMLQSGSRQTKEQLRMFRDSGRFPSFFPEVDDLLANERLAKEVINLDFYDLGESAHSGGALLKHSLGNVLRLVRPIIVMDEGHKAYSPTAWDTLNGFNPRFILELSATPNTGKQRQSNILVDVKGGQLKDEEMIKLPINVYNYGNADWKHAITQAHAKLSELAKEARSLLGEQNRYLRPMMLVRVERTGKEQREKGRIHAEDVREYLRDRLGVRPEEIKVKSSSADELGDEDLLSPESDTRYIITKDALREGWDCPFAYVLAILDRTSAQTALTQMIGRVLRQPETRRTPRPALNECYVFCFDQEVEQAVNAVRRGLEEEGMGDLGGDVRLGNGTNGKPVKRLRIPRRQEFRGVRIFLPRVLAKVDGKTLRPLDYERDVLAALNWGSIAYSGKNTFDPGKADTVEETLTLIDVDLRPSGEQEVESVGETTSQRASGEIDISFLVRQLLDVVPNPWEAARILEDTLSALQARGFTPQQLYVNRLKVLRAVKTDIQRQVDSIAEASFRDALRRGDIRFELVSAGDPALNWELAETLEIDVAEDDAVLTKRNQKPLERSLYDEIYEKQFNPLEKRVAWYVDGETAVKWWHRLVARQDYHLQGWQRNRIYPDFLVCLHGEGGHGVRLSVLETKGEHLKGNDDSEYKRRLFQLLTEHSSKFVRAGELELGVDAAVIRFHMLLEDTWESEIKSCLA